MAQKGGLLWKSLISGLPLTDPLVQIDTIDR